VTPLKGLILDRVIFVKGIAADKVEYFGLSSNFVSKVKVDLWRRMAEVRGWREASPG
jgi:hypothetical protein